VGEPDLMAFGVLLVLAQSGVHVARTPCKFAIETTHRRAYCGLDLIK
jgi:hypothetical protein